MSNFDIPQSLGTAESYGVKGEYRPFNWKLFLNYC